MKEMKNALSERQDAIVELKNFNKKEDTKEKVIEEWRVMNTELNRLKEEADVSARQMEEKYENCRKSLVSEQARSTALSKNVQVLMSQIKDLTSNKTATATSDNASQKEARNMQSMYSSLLAKAMEEQSDLKKQLKSMHSKYERLVMESRELHRDVKLNSENYSRLDKDIYDRTENVALKTQNVNNRGSEKARVHIRRSGSIYINDPNNSTTTYIPSTEECN